MRRGIHLRWIFVSNHAESTPPSQSPEYATSTLCLRNLLLVAYLTYSLSQDNVPISSFTRTLPSSIYPSSTRYRVELLLSPVVLLEPVLSNIIIHDDFHFPLRT